MREDIKLTIQQIHDGDIPFGYHSNHHYICPENWKVCLLKDKFERLKDKNGENNQNVLTISAKQGLISQDEYYNHSYASEDKSGYFLLQKGNYSYNKSYSADYPYGAIKRLDKYEKGIVSPLYICFRCKGGTVSDYYLQYFEAGIFNREIYKIAQEGARNHGLLNVSVVEFFDSYLLEPPVKEQEKIAEILNHCDKVIELKQELIVEERNRKRWLMQNLFDPDSGVRLPGFDGEWLTTTLGHVGYFSKGSGISNDDCITGQCPCIKYGDIYMSYKEHFSLSVSYTKEEIAMLSPKVSYGALLFTASGEDRLEIGKCVAYLGYDPLAVGGDIVVCLPNIERYDPKFLAYQQHTEGLIKQKSVLAQGYSIIHLYGDQIKRLKISVPPSKEEQHAISNLLSVVDDKIWLLEQELAQWKQKKKALMQLLLTGIVRVSA